MKILKFWTLKKKYLILEFWKFRNFMKTEIFEILWKFWFFFIKISEFSLLVFIILRWSFNYESNVFRYNKILIDCVFGNSKFVIPSTLTIDRGFASVNSQCLGYNKLAIPSYPVNKYILFHILLCTACGQKYCHI
jgi:hypothetical protein